jgi:hypothetical protein
MDYRWFSCVTMLLAACGGSTFRDGVYADGSTRYRVGGLDSSWQRVGVDGNDLAFHRPELGTIAINSTCSEYEDVPLPALTNQLLFDTTQRRVLLEETVTLSGRGARHTLLELELDGVPLELELYVLRRDGCVFDLSHIRSRARPEHARQVFARFVAEFDVLEVRRHD